MNSLMFINRYKRIRNNKKKTKYNFTGIRIKVLNNSHILAN